MYPRIPWEVVADTLGSAEHILGTSELQECKVIPHEKPTDLQPRNKTPTAPLYGHRELATVFTGSATCPHPEPDYPTPRRTNTINITFTSTLVSAKQFTLNH